MHPGFVYLIKQIVGNLLNTVCDQLQGRKKVQDINIFRNAKDMADQIRPVANPIDCCQADNASVAAAYM